MSKIIDLLRWLFGIHPPVQLRCAIPPTDWGQTVANLS